MSETADPQSPASAVVSDDAPDPKAESASDPHGAADLDAIEHDLAGVEAALERLDDGTYGTDEVTGAAIADDVLADDPLARRA